MLKDRSEVKAVIQVLINFVNFIGRINESLRLFCRFSYTFYFRSISNFSKAPGFQRKETDGLFLGSRSIYHFKKLNHVSTSYMEEHCPYRDRLHREPDFVVEYELDPCKEMRSSKPGQGMRVDFLYEGEDPTVEGIHMIWPEILCPDGSVMRDTTPGAIPTKGKANMWAFNESTRAFHALKLKVGTKGYWVRGGFHLANVVVVEIGCLKC